MQTLLIRFPEETLDYARLRELPGAPHAGLCLYHAADHAESYALLPAPQDLASLAAVLRRQHPRAQAVAMTLAGCLPGQAAGMPAPWLYMVETDVTPQAEEDFDRWYDQEHLPGLAAVPGTVRARRYVAADASPRYIACYDLASRETFGSPAWLAVRATAWSDRVRPHFINTKRTMFRAVPDNQET
ncbi:hypothetical protein CDO44_25565 [Pigmentiphaga sp. NML080357]|uniref:DUF4286 family protein n=1 Tax=Pigmentiphaga sp. NML080357 TaxID=2008675 RepID=UPI000B40E3A0|nr:DUF4286 family protein [Pigmentiphaga sp. NML080357]OVZ55561.1 hypothetical protein CDO44_25565 [Pigmentiphaga sp. NML080357]